MADEIISETIPLGNSLTTENLREILTYNPETGQFVWRLSVSRFIGKTAGYKQRSGYIVININYTLFYAHRLAWLYMTSEWPPELIDHINGDKSDNRWSNLRLANKSQNAANTKLLSTNKSGKRGVSWDKINEKWVAQIRSDGKIRKIGRFLTIEEAAKAYEDEFKKLHGEFARLK